MVAWAHLSLHQRVHLLTVVTKGRTHRQTHTDRIRNVTTFAGNINFIVVFFHRFRHGKYAMHAMRPDKKLDCANKQMMKIRLFTT